MQFIKITLVFIVLISSVPRWILQALILLFVGALLPSSGLCQGVGVGNNSTPPFPGAILDVRAETKGVLLPRTDTASIILPAKGMIIYDTLISSFAFYNGQRWLSLLSIGDYSFWWADQDGDGYGFPFNVIYAPSGPQFYVSNNLDCDDSNGSIGMCNACDNTPPCDDGNPCTLDACVNDVCVHTPAPAGNACSLPNGMPGVCDGAGNCIESECTGSPPCDDGNPCTVDECVNGVCIHTPALAGSVCSLPNGMPGVCDGTGNCIESECTGTPPCDDGNPCTIDVCVNGVCVHTPALAGSACSLPNGMPGVCDGTGNCIESGCTGTPPCDDGNPCTIDECVNGICVYTPAPAGTPCSSGTCDGQGGCQ